MSQHPHMPAENVLHLLDFEGMRVCASFEEGEEDEDDHQVQQYLTHSTRHSINVCLALKSTISNWLTHWLTNIAFKISGVRIRKHQENILGLNIDLVNSLKERRCCLGGTGCSGKIVFFSQFMQPLPRLYRCKRPSKLLTQCKCTVTPNGW